MFGVIACGSPYAPSAGLASSSTSQMMFGRCGACAIGRACGASHGRTSTATAIRKRLDIDRIICISSGALPRVIAGGASANVLLGPHACVVRTRRDRPFLGGRDRGLHNDWRRGAPWYPCGCSGGDIEVLEWGHDGSAFDASGAVPPSRVG